MQKIIFNEAMATLQTFYGRKLTDEQKDLWFKQLYFLHDLDAKEAARRILAEERLFPTPNVFQKYADQAREYRQSKELQRDSETCKKTFASQRYNKQIAKDCCNLIQDVLGKKPDVDVIDEMLKLEVKYPKIKGINENGEIVDDSFAYNAGMLEKFYKKIKRIRWAYKKIAFDFKAGAPRDGTIHMVQSIAGDDKKWNEFKIKYLETVHKAENHDALPTIPEGF
jgi:hypothetical protein